MSLLLPFVFIAAFVCAFVKKVNAYGSFIQGAKEAVPLAVSLFPFVAAVIIAVELMRASGLYNVFNFVFSPLLKLLGIPEELSQLALLRPFSGSGSLALLNDVFTVYGPDSYVGRCASVMFGSTETVFYIATVYFSGTKVRKLGGALVIALACCVLSAALACLLCKFM